MFYELIATNFFLLLSVKPLTIKGIAPKCNKNNRVSHRRFTKYGYFKYIVNITISCYMY